MSRSEPSLASVHELEPLLRQHAPGAELNRKMAPEVISELIDAGLFRMWIPRTLGGFEMEPNAALAIIEELARIDPATGWVVSNCSFISMMPQLIGPAGQPELLDRPDAVMCGSFVPAAPPSAVPDGDGFRVSGTWAFGSAAEYASSLAVNTILTDEHGPVAGPDGAAKVVVVYLRPDQVTIHDTWHTLGLRGTGSTTFSAANAFVPAKFAAPLAPCVPAGSFDRPLYRLGIIIDAVRIGSVGVGIAQGALDETVELALGKVPAYTASVTAQRPTVQERVARAQALIQAARNNTRATMADAYRAAESGSRVSGAGILPQGLAAAFALDASVQAVELLYEVAGSTGFRDESPIQKRFRDIQTLRQNAITSWSRYESLGKLIFGGTSDWALHNI